MLLIAVAALLLWCVIIAYRQYAAAEATNREQIILAHDADLLAVRTNDTLTQQTVDYDFFRISFNPAYHIPNWVAWELTADETDGDMSRTKFMHDSRVDGCARPADYTGSGYDRGHMAPAADMKWDEDAMTRCFYMTNICPQAHSLNSGTWKKLEEKCRIWAKADSAIIIVCGPVFTPRPEEFIGETQVAVPKSFFKVICAPYATPPRAIGFIMPNGKIQGGLQAAAVSVDEVERITGHDFFSALPDDIENIIEAECKFHLWSTIKPQK